MSKVCSNGHSDPVVALGLCKSCYKKQYRKKNHNKLIFQERNQALYNKKNRLKSLEKFRYSTKGRYGYMKRDAPRRELSCTITLSEYEDLLSLPCYYCEKKMPISMGTGLDRKDNNEGYDLGNVLTCCGDCNLLRMHKLTVEETKLLSMTLRNYREKK